MPLPPVQMPVDEPPHVDDDHDGMGMGSAACGCADHEGDAGATLVTASWPAHCMGDCTGGDDVLSERAGDCVGGMRMAAAGVRSGATSPHGCTPALLHDATGGTRARAAAAAAAVAFAAAAAAEAP